MDIHNITTEFIQKKIEEKKALLTDIVGAERAEELIENALKLIKEGKKSITDVIDLK